jgi:hypothetical protein
LKLKVLLCSLVITASLCAQQPAGTLTNQRIGDLVQAGVSSSEIIRIIGSAETVNFDLRSGSTDNLLSAGVSEEIKGDGGKGDQNPACFPSSQIE